MFAFSCATPGTAPSTARRRAPARPREKNVEFEARDGTMRTKTLVWLKDIDGYKRPHENLPDTFEDVEEAWFAEDALRKMQGDLLDGVSFN
ncbi:MAG: hypothetical protein U5R48_12530 [Gammaproteobacteria bacterium]|nr:hypothetical protein [Gammaproteobacteria bacterium]